MGEEGYPRLKLGGADGIGRDKPQWKPTRQPTSPRYCLEKFAAFMLWVVNDGEIGIAQPECQPSTAALNGTGYGEY